MLVVGGGVAGPAAVAGTHRGDGGDSSDGGASATTNAGPDGVTKKSNNGMDAASISSSASTVAEAARIAAARAVNRGLLKAVESGGVAFVSEEERRRAGSIGIFVERVEAWIGVGFNLARCRRRFWKLFRMEPSRRTGRAD